MDLDALRALLAVAETGSVLGASERLGLPRATLRRRLDALEATVGAALVVRGPAGAALTEAGEAAAVHARAVLAEGAALLAAARAAGETAAGVLHVVVPVGLPPTALALVHAVLRAAHPHLRIDLRVVEDPLADGLHDVDLAFHFGDRAEAGPWITRVVLPIRERLLASPAYLETRGTPRAVDALADHTLLSWRRPGADPAVWPTVEGPVPVTPAVVSADVHVLRTIAAAGGGLALLPDGRAPGGLIPDDGLVPVLEDVVGRDCPLRVLVAQPLARAPKVRAVLESVLSMLAEG